MRDGVRLQLGIHCRTRSAQYSRSPRAHNMRLGAWEPRQAAELQSSALEATLFRTTPRVMRGVDPNNSVA